MGMLQAELVDGTPNQDFFSVLDQACRKANISPPEHITLDQLNIIRARVRELIQQWQRVQPGESLELEFEVAVESV